MVVALMLAACGSSTGTQPSGPRQVSPQIDSVEVLILESFPVQVNARVQGTLGDGCTSMGEMTQQRNGNEITVTITANHSGAETCTMIAQLLDETIPLEGEFPTGEYVLRVNGVEERFQV
jgi:inhibitor of cysteine peptidase